MAKELTLGGMDENLLVSMLTIYVMVKESTIAKMEESIMELITQMDSKVSSMEKAQLSFEMELFIRVSNILKYLFYMYRVTLSERSTDKQETTCRKPK